MVDRTDAPEIDRIRSGLDSLARLRAIRSRSASRARRAWIPAGASPDLIALVSEYNDARDVQAAAAARLAVARSAIAAHPASETVTFAVVPPGSPPPEQVATDLAKVAAECYNAIHAAVRAGYSWNHLGRLLSPRNNDHNWARRFVARNEPDPDLIAADLVTEEF